MSKDAMARIARAERTIKATLLALSLPIRGSYSPEEVRNILGISRGTFWRLIKACERDDAGRLIRNDCLDSFMLGSNRRVTYLELVDFIRRNNGAEREAAGG